MKTVRIFLLVVILIGLGLLATQRYWMPSFVDALLRQSTTVIPSTSFTPDQASAPAASTTAEAAPDNWTWVYSTTSSAGTQFKYPDPFPVTSISPVDWPPQVMVIAGTVSCTPGTMASHSGEATETIWKKINGQDFCIATAKAAAAGSSYTNYQYSNQRGNFVASVSFTLRSPRCLNYDAEKQQACQAEQTAFNADDLAYKILQSLTMH